MNAQKLIETKGLIKAYSNSKVITKALNGIDLIIRQGEFVLIVGPSGSGKTTLLHVLGGLEPYDGGRVRLLGRELAQRSRKELAELRSRDLGFVFQFYNLLPELNVYENVRLAAVLGKNAQKEAIIKVLEEVGMSEHLHKYPRELSGGMQQRVAIARSLINDPQIILADEPTGNLDQKNGEAIMELFSKLHRSLGKTIIMVTHNEETIRYGTRTIRMVDGSITGDEEHAR
jgi:putative ABC transport system ATP-binding protein